MYDFKIITDTTTDLPMTYIEKNNIGLMYLNCIIEGKTYGKDNMQELDLKSFYKGMREGKMPTTSQINPEEAKAEFEKYVETEKEILCLAFSSGLSGSYNSMRIAAEEVMEEHPECKIRVIDSLCASLGEGLFVHQAVEQRRAGKTMKETAKWLTEHIQNIVHVFTVDDLFHLYRGGRVSKTSAVIGTVAAIKPVLHVDYEGHLIPIMKKRGRKKALNCLVDYMEEKQGSFLEDNRKGTVFISHSDALEDAEYVRDEIKKRFGIENFVINMIGPVIGSHTGTGTIALFFMGESR
ncbi:MAG: DegV family protein [Lachnospiraceae bacterium]|nr:DegV family protein [Lachnospiraceae bacterium]